MLKHLLCFATALVAAQATGNIVFLHSPPSVNFNVSSSEKVEQSLLKEVYAASLGYTVKQKGYWSAMTIIDPFELPEAVVAIPIDGIDSLDVPKGQRFPLLVNEAEETTWQALRGRLEERGTENILVRISLGDGLDALGHSVIGELKPAPIDETKLKALSLKREEDKKYLEEVQLLYAIAKKIRTVIKPDTIPDIYWLVLSGLRPIFDLHGRNSTAAREALHLLNNALDAINEAFVEVYDGKAIIATFTNDQSLTVRRTRAADEKEGEKEPKNLSKDYSENYPVIFNIILWFGVAFFFSLLAICITIAQMDPGRDSIIYRMTSNRMKKDN